MSRQRGSWKSFILGSIIGAVVGILAIILYAPQQTKQWRRKLEKKARRWQKIFQKLLRESEKLSADLDWGEKIERVREFLGLEDWLSPSAEEAKEEKEKSPKAEKKETHQAQTVTPNSRREKSKTSSSPLRRRPRKKLFKGI